MKNKVAKILSIMGLAMAIASAFGVTIKEAELRLRRQMTKEEVQNFQSIQRLIEKYKKYATGTVEATYMSERQIELFQEYLSELEYYLDFQTDPKFGKKIKGLNRFITMSFQGEIDQDQILELFCILNGTARHLEMGKEVARKVFTEKDLIFQKWFLESCELKEELDLEFLKAIRGEPCALRDSFEDSLESVCQEYLDAAQEYLKAWPNLKPLQGRNSLVNQRCCTSTVIDLESSAKCGIFRERMRKMGQDMMD